MSLSLSMGMRLGLSLGGGSGTAPYTGLVASGFMGALGFVKSGTTGSFTSLMSRASFVAASNITNLKAAYANFKDIYGTVAVSAGLVLTASVEYPAGTFTRLTFGGLNTGNVASGTIGETDLVSISIPKGAMFWIRTYQANGGTVLYSTGGRSANGDAFATNGPDLTMTSGTMTTSATTFSPIAVLGTTTGTSVGLIGDSIQAGKNGTAYYAGIMSGALGDAIPHVNFGVSGSTAGLGGAYYLTQLFSPLKTFLDTYCPVIVTNHGTNDLGTVTATSTALSALSALLGQFTLAKKKLISTLIPRTASTDGWITDANQTVYYTGDAQPGYTTFNAAVRAGSVSGANDYFDVYPVLVSGTRDEVWINSPSANYYTSDGTHPNQPGYDLVKNSGAIVLSKLALP